MLLHLRLLICKMYELRLRDKEVGNLVESKL